MDYKGTTTGEKPKSGRNSDKRRERSKVAARCRRGKESEIFGDLASCLPITESVRSTLDKASIMRLALCHLKIREIMEKDFDCGPANNNEEDMCKNYDSFLTEALGGFLLVLSTEGEVIYSSAATATYLGLSEAELMKCSIYEFTHPEDHKEIKEALVINKRDNEEIRNAARLFSCRMKCTITSRGRNIHTRHPSYKVINFRGRIFEDSKDVSSRCFVGVGEVLPHPSDVDIPLNKQTFLSKHSLDFKFEHVDDSINGFLGYQPEDLMEKSFFEYINFSEKEVNPLIKIFSALHSKGQAVTEIYRFLAKHGGWVWIRTVATVLYNNSGTARSIVCLHFIASGIENGDEIVSNVQCPKKPIENIVCSSNSVPEVERIKTVSEKNEESADKENNPNAIDVPLLNNPIASTRKVFTRKTDDMDKGFLIPFDNTMIESKEDQEDLTHLAPMAGDECVQLCPPLLDDLLETLDNAEIEYAFDGIIVDVNADELPQLSGQPSSMIRIVSNLDGENERELTSMNTGNSPLFLNSDPHMTFSPDSKSLPSPFQNSNVPNDCENNICDLDAYNSTFPIISKVHHSQPSVPNSVGKPDCFHRMTAEISTFEMSTTDESWNCFSNIQVPISDQNTSPFPYFVSDVLECKIGPLDPSPGAYSVHVGCPKAFNEKLPDILSSSSLFSNSVQQNTTSSPTMCSIPMTGFSKANDVSLSCAAQRGYSNDIKLSLKTAKDFRVEGKGEHSKSIEASSRSGSELGCSINPVNPKSTFIPPEVSRKKVRLNLELPLVVKVKRSTCKKSARVVNDMCFNGPATDSNALTMGSAICQTPISKGLKRRKLVSEVVQVTNAGANEENKPDGKSYHSVEQMDNRSTKRKRDLLGRLLCSPFLNEKLSLRELTRQDYEVNAPLGANGSLLQGPDLINALETENFTELII